MEFECRKCNHSSHLLITLNCHHSICPKCINIKSQTACICPICFVMTPTYPSNQQFADPETSLICLQCRNQVFTMKQFLQGSHRSHQIASIAKIIPEMQKKLRKYQLSLQLETQSLFRQIEQRSQEKMHISEEYGRNIFDLKERLSILRQQIEKKEDEITKQYQRIVCNKVDMIDKLVGQMRQKIKISQSYSSSIQSHLLQSSRIHPISSASFLITFQSIFHQFASKLADYRLQSRLQISKMPTIDSQQLNSIHQQIAKMKLWKSNDHIIESGRYCLKNDDIQQYFQNKRKQIFDTSSDQTNSTTTFCKYSDTGRRDKKYGENQGVKGFDIEGRIENLRRTLRIGQ